MDSIFAVIRDKQVGKLSIVCRSGELQWLQGQDKSAVSRPGDGVLFTRLEGAVRSEGHERVDFYDDPTTGAQVVVAVHSTKLGRPYGGLRRISPAGHATPQDADWAAIVDALRLSKAMTFKCIGAGMPNGGSKIVVLGDPEDSRYDNPSYYESLARVIEDSGSVTGPDMGFTVAQASRIAEYTKCIVGYDESDGGTGPTGDTAGFGVYLAMKVSAQARWGSADLGGRKVAIQGVGCLGAALAECLAAEGVELFISDPRQEALDDTMRRIRPQTATVVPPDEILSTHCDVLAPCAHGAVLNPATIPSLACEIVCGGANNMLDDERRDSAALHDRGILYAVDWIANAGGVLNGEEAYFSRELDQPFRLSRVLSRTHYACYDGLARVFALATEQSADPLEIAYKLAGDKLNL